MVLGWHASRPPGNGNGGVDGCHDGCSIYRHCFFLISMGLTYCMSTMFFLISSNINNTNRYIYIIFFWNINTANGIFRNLHQVLLMCIYMRTFFFTLFIFIHIYVHKTASMPYVLNPCHVHIEPSKELRQKNGQWELPLRGFPRPPKRWRPWRCWRRPSCRGCCDGRCPKAGQWPTFRDDIPGTQMWPLVLIEKLKRALFLGGESPSKIEVIFGFQVFHRKIKFKLKETCSFMVLLAE